MADEDLLRQAVDRAWAYTKPRTRFTRRMNGAACLSDICSRGGRRERMILKS